MLPRVYLAKMATSAHDITSAGDSYSSSSTYKFWMEFLHVSDMTHKNMVGFFKIRLCLLFIQNGKFTFEKLHLSIQGWSPTFDIGDLPFKAIAVIQHRVHFFRDKWLLVSRAGQFCSRFTTFIRDGVLFVQDKWPLVQERG